MATLPSSASLREIAGYIIAGLQLAQRRPHWTTDHQGDTRNQGACWYGFAHGAETQADSICRQLYIPPQRNKQGNGSLNPVYLKFSDGGSNLRLPLRSGEERDGTTVAEKNSEQDGCYLFRNERLSIRGTTLTCPGYHRSYFHQEPRHAGRGQPGLLHIFSRSSR